ncbi:ABI gene family member 3 isoform X1 [Alligator sinensis]|uniref:ABI gene family member 3 n=1 Tax=Alligator sinensis TaxID=38654 RepID=A0A1U7RH68_ALLSI|nr:ABI gene family member 3 isoform X1 [Alligator sinensis]
MSELQQLEQHEIPSARQVLWDNYSNLHKVADYCENNYMQAEDKRKALEETMAYSAQSLASVAYQISNLASKVLKMLDLQAAELCQLEASICSTAQMVDMHKEKVVRREIGTLAVCKKPPLYQKIIYPQNLERREPYFRKPLNFSILDDVGHGIKDQSTQLSRTGTLARKSIKTAGQSSNTLGRNPRVAEPIQPPVVPEGKLSASTSTLSLTSLSSLPGSINAKVPEAPPPPPTLPTAVPAPLMGIDPMPPPLADVPAPPPIAFEMPPIDFLPPLPMPDPDFMEPPPPPALTDFEDLAPLPPPPPLDIEELSWVPDNYLEKVVTLYPYTQQKENELSFQEGTVVYVTRRYSDGWCEGVTSEAEGFFPGNYVEPFCE